MAKSKKMRNSFLFNTRTDFLVNISVVPDNFMGFIFLDRFWFTLCELLTPILIGGDKWYYYHYYYYYLLLLLILEKRKKKQTENVWSSCPRVCCWIMDIFNWAEVKNMVCLQFCMYNMIIIKINLKFTKGKNFSHVLRSKSKNIIRAH